MIGIVCTVTNDLSYDQRMRRICATLAAAGYAVTLVGRSLPRSIPLEARPYDQKRLRCWFRKGFLFYAEYNWRLFWYLLFQKRFDVVCSVDFDTLPAGCLAALLRRKKRVFDAHEYFTEVPEVVDRPFVKAFWTWVGRCCLPWYHRAYTVGPCLAELFEQQHHLPFAVVRNVPEAISDFGFRISDFGKHALDGGAQSEIRNPKSNVILYQGALNEGRGLEALIEAMADLPAFDLWLAGEGDLSEPLRRLAGQSPAADRIRFWGFVRPDDLKQLTAQAWLGVNLLENRGLSYYYSLANKFFDCVQATVPILTMAFPEYLALNRQYEVAVLLPDTATSGIVAAVQNLAASPERYAQLQRNASQARQEWHWGREQQVLLDCYARL